jgi:NitT/TauT family transport system substrate-binding protein
MGKVLDHRARMRLAVAGLAVVAVASSVAAVNWNTRPASAQALEKVSLRLDWAWWPGQTQFLVAREKGFYREVGLDVDINQGQGSGNTVIVVGEGKDPLGFADMGAVALAISKGVPIRAVATVQQKAGTSLIFLKGTKISGPKDLEGKRLGTTPTGSDAQRLPAFIAANGLDKDKITIVGMPGDAKLAALLTGQVDVISGDNFFYVPQIKAKGKEGLAVQYADHGVNLLGTGYIANRKFLQEKPDVVRRFVAASLKGLDYTFKNLDESMGIFLKATQSTEMQEVYKDIMTVWRTSFHTKSTEGKPIGWQSEKDWESSLEILEKFGGLTGRKPAGEYFTNDFLPKS